MKLSQKDKRLGKDLLIQALVAVVKRWWQRRDQDPPPAEKPSKND